MTKKTESVEEYLARGGEIDHVPTQEVEELSTVLKPTNTVTSIMSLDDGELFFAEKQIRKKVSAEEKEKKGREKLSLIASKYLPKKD